MNIKNFQKLIKDLYLHRDSKRGIEKTFLWLVEEIGELSRELKKEDKDLEKISEELADIVAWTTSVANLLDIDLHKSIGKKYSDKCIKCGKNPCICRSISN